MALLAQPGAVSLGQPEGPLPLAVGDEPDRRHPQSSRLPRRAAGAGSTATATAPRPWIGRALRSRSAGRARSMPARRWTRNSTLPSAPRNGETMTPIMVAPAASRAAITPSKGLPPDLGVPDHAPASATPRGGPPRTGASPGPPGRRRAGPAPAVAGHGAQRDERQVGDHHVERLAAEHRRRWRSRMLVRSSDHDPGIAAEVARGAGPGPRRPPPPMLRRVAAGSR